LRYRHFSLLQEVYKNHFLVPGKAHLRRLFKLFVLFFKNLGYGNCFLVGSSRSGLGFDSLVMKW
jgi:hypothetical protein